MATRVAFAPVASTVLPASDLVKLPGGWIGYNQVTATQSGITTEVALTTLTVTVTVGTSRRIRITGQTWLSSTVAGDVHAIYIKESAVQIGRGQSIAAAGGVGITTIGQVILTPTAGAHTYYLTCLRTAGTGSVSSNASTNDVPFILVEDMGPAS